MTITFILIGLFIVICAIIFDRSDKKRFTKNGAEVDATITKVIPIANSSKYRLELKYTIKGYDFYAGMITSKVYLEGNKITIQYLQDDPSEILIPEVEENAKKSISGNILYILGFAFILGGVICGMTMGWLE